MHPILYSLMRCESSRGHKKDGARPNQTGNTLGEETNKQTGESRLKEADMEVALQGTSSPGQDSEEKKSRDKRQTKSKIADRRQSHNIDPQQDTQERCNSYISSGTQPDNGTLK